ncbi:hypothetical protein CDL15_Pgr014101 [Punica granatum]|nr:hypothetical protein CDL15_Pgr014101 [Punica granatum]
MGRARERGNVGEDEDGRRGGSDDRERRFPPLGAATTAREGTGDGYEHRLGYAVLGRGVARLGSVGIEENFGFSARFSSFSTRGFQA